MRKWINGVLAVLLLCVLLPALASATSDCGDHVWGDWQTEREPGCTDPGMKVRYCRNCMQYQEEEIPALGHSWGAWETEAEASCSREGRRCRYCARCQERQEEAVPKTSHQYSDWVTAKEPTCAEAGTRTKTCSVCGDMQSEPIAKLTEHTYGDWEVTKEATCAETGTKTKTCTFCGSTQTEPIAKTSAHQFGDWAVTREATCKQDGVRTRTCSVCGIQETEPISKTTAHQFGSWVVTQEATCKKDGIRTRTCSVCGIQETETVSSTSAHQFGSWIVTLEATCSRDGTQARTCTVCGMQETESIAKTGEHQYGDWIDTVPASCKSAGKRTRTCSVCGDRQTESIPKLEHVYGEWTVRKEATCTRDGKEQCVCELCGAVRHQVVKALGHSFSEWEIIQEATDESKGTRSAVCSRCGKKVTEDYYPEGTLYKGGSNPPEAVTELQSALAELGLYKGKISGEYGSATVSAVKSFEKSYLGMKSDGVAWPKVLKGLGLPAAGPVSSDTSKVKLQLEADMASPGKDAYSEGDEITFSWTLTNSSGKDDAVSVSLCMFRGMKPDRITDTEIARSEVLAPGETTSGTYVYRVTADDVLAGKFTIGFVSRCRYKKKDDSSNRVWLHFRSSAAGIANSARWTPPGVQQLAVSGKVGNKPKNKLFFVRDETIEYLITVANTSKYDIDNVLLTNSLIPGFGGTASFSIKAGDIKFFSMSYVVMAEDIPGGEVVNTVTASYTGPDGTLKSARVNARTPVGFSTKSLYIYKTVIGTPANGMFYLPGEVISYEISVVNPTGRTFTDIRLYDELNTDPKEPIKKIGTLGPHEVKTVSFRHHTAKFEAATGQCINVAYATFTDPDKSAKQEVSNLCVVPAGLESSDGVIVKKSIVSVPENGRYYEDAEEIRYVIEVTNNTVQDITDMDVRDVLAPLDSDGYRTVFGHESLPAGETRSYPFSFLVGPADVENTRVTNVASVYWTINGTDYLESFSEPVVAPVSEITVPRVAKKVSREGASCGNPLTGTGDGVTEHDVVVCDRHAETAVLSKQLVGSQSYDEAKALWNGEIDQLYGEWISRADAEGARNAEDEKAAFELQIKALENSISLLCDPAEANAIAVGERMNKCVLLCYELHSAPEARSDILSADHAVLKKVGTGNECSRDVSWLVNGSAHIVDHPCESHNATVRLAEGLLKSIADDADRAVVWQRIQGSWLLQLNVLYDQWYLAADESQRAAVAADRMSFGRLIEARRKTLGDLYPDNPAVAAEVLSNMIMERTMLICRLLHSAGILAD